MRKLSLLSVLLALVSASAHAADFSSLLKAPLQKRPNTDETIRANGNHPLVRALHTDGVQFYRLRYLLPQKFRLVDGTKFQPLIDATALRIFSTKSGKESLCSFASDGESGVEMYFQVSKKAAGQILSLCKGVKVPQALRNYLQAIRRTSLPFAPEPLVPAKKFVFVLAEEGQPEVEGYTTRKNATYLILGRDSLNEAHLLRLMAHELAISYDQLSRLAYLQDPVRWDRELHWAFGRTIRDPEVFAPMSTREVAELKCAYRDPAVKYAATAQRAFVFEDAVAQELGLGGQAAAPGSCSQVLAKNSVLLQALSRAISWETQTYEILCAPLAKNPAARLDQMLTRVRSIEATRLKLANGGRMSLCDLILKPRLGPAQPDIYAGGPRPRMGGWEGGTSSLAERALQGERLGAGEVSALGDALSFPDSETLYREEDEREGRGR